jgi:hypothetical protein
MPFVLDNYIEALTIQELQESEALKIICLFPEAF